MLFLHELPIGMHVCGSDTLDALGIAFPYVKHLTGVGNSSEWISIARANMRHVDAKHPKQPLTFASGNGTKRVEKTSHTIVFFRQTAFVNTLHEGSAQNRQDAHARAVDVLQEHDLELD